MTENQTQAIAVAGRRGGARAGAGRPSLIRRGMQKANGWQCDPLYAAVILGQVIDERRAWQRVFESPDDRVILQGLMFLVSMRDGKPAQRISVTSTNVNINASDVERAREIAAEFRRAFAPPSDSPSLGEVSAENESIMLPSAEGDKRDGEDGSGL